MRDLLKRYAKLALGQPFTPAVLNILVTSVCDMRCTHCFFTEQLDDAPRKKLQMSTREIEKISETMGGNLGVLKCRVPEMLKCGVDGVAKILRGVNEGAVEIKNQKLQLFNRNGAKNLDHASSVMGIGATEMSLAFASSGGSGAGLVK